MDNVTVSLVVFGWTFAEIIILVYMRQFYRALTHQSLNTKGAVSLASMVVAFFIVILFMGDQIRPLLYPKDNYVFRAIHHQMVWDFFCMLWVLMEGLIGIFGIAMIGVLRFALDENPQISWEQNLKSRNRFIMLMCTGFIVAMMTFYAAFQYMCVYAVLHNLVSSHYVMRSHNFYNFSCGFLWIAVDGVVALYGFKLLELIKKHKDTFDELTIPPGIETNGIATNNFK